ncbi:MULTISPECIES: hypothetical protein [unclassified Picosynechococcus]|uniref:hypothetical protein n=1 Tax=unclassified Picosynechococcus TaxID=3079910 RepID=UPI0004AB887F|nr:MULTISPECIES: hypothetical protein [unclassified Picosynechococcus]AMA08137.1 hypothetical protein AWQ23_01715 [Picosynechococcus sp. PCC 73109]ANV86277.1 hypothetical protein AWQ22_01630 [Picosynechococcus sp. PCC 7117]
MSVQGYINELKHQLDLLYQTVEQMQQGLGPTGQSLSEADLMTMVPKIDPAVFGLDFRVGGESFHHKDVLFDETLGLEGRSMDEKQMSPEWQIKRLTAQLTVAYKRIAQLEEQLLSQQNEHNGSEYIYS